MNSIEKTYYFVPLSGSAYEIGRMQGNAIKDIPGWVDFLASGPAEWPDNSYPRLEKLYQNHCPGLLEEIQGGGHILINRHPRSTVQLAVRLARLLLGRSSFFAELPLQFILLLGAVSLPLLQKDLEERRV